MSQISESSQADLSEWRSVDLFGTRLDATSYEQATRTIIRWALAGESRTVVACNVHVLMEARDSEVLRRSVNSADLITPDGMPLVWAMRRKIDPAQKRVYGPDLTVEVLNAAAREGVTVGFFGGQPQVLETLVAMVRQKFPGIRIGYAESPPFRDPTPEEDQAFVDAINRSGARILFVGLGCPKQEHWIASHKGRISSVMLAVGAAFDFLAGTKPQAPRWIMSMGMEWAFRLATEPRRLWKRYLKHNPRFVGLLVRDQLTSRGAKH